MYLTCLNTIVKETCLKLFKSQVIKIKTIKLHPTVWLFITKVVCKLCKLKSWVLKPIPSTLGHSSNRDLILVD